MPPNLDKSFFVKYPIRLIIPNVPAVTKNVVATDSFVYAANITERVNPFTNEYSKNNSKDVENDILCILALIIITNANSPIINPQNKIEFENIEYINSVDCATYSATTPVMPKARVIHIYTLFIN